MRHLRGHRGQIVIEFLLLAVITIAVLTALTGKLKESQLVQKLVTSPWAKVAGMVETGTWNEAGDPARKKHPNTFGRFYTPREN